jgi:RNA polymerase sigma-70 factor, ECF subfamily
MDEQAAIARLQQGDISGLEALVQAYQVPAMRAAILITRDRSSSEDIVQAAFLRVYERIGQFDNTRPFGPWFLRSVLNDAIKVATRQAHQVSLNYLRHGADNALVDNTAGPDELVEQAETVQAIQTALNSLSPTQRAVIVQRYYLGLSETEIAVALGCPPGTVKSRLHAARLRFRTLLHPGRRTTSASLIPDNPK